MTRPDRPPLDTGDPFPEIRLDLTDGSALTLPADLRGRFAVVLAYRGHW